MNFCTKYDDCFSTRVLKEIKSQEEIYSEMFIHNGGFIIFNETIFNKKDILKVVAMLYHDNIDTIVNKERFENLSLYLLCHTFRKSWLSYPSICEIKDIEVFIHHTSNNAVLGVRYNNNISMSTYQQIFKHIQSATNIFKQLVECVHDKDLEDLAKDKDVYNLYKDTLKKQIYDM